MKVSIVIPAYNEEKRIVNTLLEYGNYYKKLKKDKKQDFEIIVVINCSTDRTEEIVKNFSKKIKEIRFMCLDRKGKGRAITEGFREALRGEADLIGFVDADMATPPEAFHDLIKNIHDVDVVIADRTNKKSIIKPKQTVFRTFMGRGFNWIVRVLFFFPFKDTQCGAKLFRKDIAKKIINRLGNTEWSFDVDLLFYSRKEGAKIKSIPTIWKDMKGSKINRKTPIRMFLSVVRLRVYHSPFSGAIKIYDKIPEKMKFHHRW